MEFYICYNQAKMLRPLIECEQERGAIERLVNFKGSEADLRLAASMYERVGEGANAAELLSNDSRTPARSGAGGEPELHAMALALRPRRPPRVDVPRVQPMSNEITEGRRKHPHDFPGSQAATLRGEDGEVAWSMFDGHVRFRYLSEPGDGLWALVDFRDEDSSLVPIGPVARALIRCPR